MNPNFEYEIYGKPVLDGHVVTVQDLRSRNLSEPSVLDRFVGALRGQFAIIMREANVVTAVTDLFGSYPVYFRNGQVSSSAASLTGPDTCRLCKEAFFSFASLGRNVTDYSFFEGVKRMPAGAIMKLANGRVAAIRHYFKMEQLVDCTEMSMADAHERFMSLASSYLCAINRDSNSSKVLFSSGIDSALTVALLRKFLPDATFSGLSIDYAPIFRRRYSEYKEAEHNAEQFGLQLRKVICSAEDFYSAVKALVEDRPDIPPSDRAMPIQFKSLSEGGPGIYYTGFNADRTFGGHGHWLKLARQYSRMLNPDASVLTASEKAEILCFPADSRINAMETLVQSAGFSADEFRQWIGMYKDSSVAKVEKYDPLDFLKLIMLLSEEENGHLWMFEHLLLEQHFNVNFVSMFGDIEMVKLGLSLPPALHFLDGQPKYFLREVLRVETGMDVRKRAFPSPMRFWSMRPCNALMPSSQALRKIVRRAWMNNVFAQGRKYALTHDVLTTALWLDKMGWA